MTTGLLVSTMAAIPVAEAQQAPEAAPASTLAAPLALEPGEAAGFTDDVRPTAWSDCPRNFICFWTGKDGKGGYCSFRGGDNYDKAYQSCWMNDEKPYSVWNRTSWRYHYYAEAGYHDRKGSTIKGDRGNLTGTYFVKSLCRHNWGNCRN